MSTVIDKLAELGIVVRPDGKIEQRVPCPPCGKDERDDALGVNLETGVFHCFRCSWSGRAGDRLSRPPALRVTLPRSAPSGDTLALIWARTVPLRGTLGAVYLEHRRCVLPPPDSDLRYLPASERYPPTLCGLVTNIVTGKPQSLHFTQLKSDGSGRLERKLLGGHPKKLGCIRLWPDEAVSHGLAVGEGVETVLSLAHAFRPAWSLIDAGNLAELPVLPGIESLLIAADNDQAGLAAARACGSRWSAAGRDVRLAMPERAGADVNDTVAA